MTDMFEVDELPAPPRIDIPEADRELLELAARAMGAVRFEEIDGEGYGNLHFPDGSVNHAWNPLKFEGDAFDLAVRLPGLDLQWIIAEAWRAHAGHDARRLFVQRGITRAAAETIRGKNSC